MKKLSALLICMVMLCMGVISSGIAETDKEILFRNIPWGTDYATVEKDNPDWNLYKLSGAIYDVKSVKDVLHGGSGYTNDYEYTDINIISHNWNDLALNVAGYTATSVNLYFAYVPVNGILTRDEKDSALYGALYKFGKVNDVFPIEEDLKTKLSKLYGAPDKTDSDQSWTGKIDYRYIYWYGANDTVVCLYIRDSKDSEDSEFCISYAWQKGDDLLKAANQNEMDRVSAADSAIKEMIDENADNIDGL